MHFVTPKYADELSTTNEFNNWEFQSVRFEIALVFASYLLSKLILYSQRFHSKRRKVKWLKSNIKPQTYPILKTKMPCSIKINN